MCAASGAMPQAFSKSLIARSKAAGSKAFWRGMPMPAGICPGWSLQSGMDGFRFKWLSR